MRRNCRPSGARSTGRVISTFIEVPALLHPPDASLPASNPASSMATGIQEPSSARAASSIRSKSAVTTPEAMTPNAMLVASCATGPSIAYSFHSGSRMGRLPMLSKKPICCSGLSIRNQRAAAPETSRDVARTSPRKRIVRPRRLIAGTVCMTVANPSMPGLPLETGARRVRFPLYGPGTLESPMPAPR